MLRLSSVAPYWMDESPSVTVSASWLKDYGFEIGKKVVVEVSQGVITIKPLDSEEEL